jgi:hypothetical protein
MKRVRSFLLLLVVSAASLVGPSSVQAHVLARHDADDAKGPLDLKTVTVDHNATDSLTYTLETYGRWDGRDLGQRSYFALLFDRNEDGVADRCIFIYRPALKMVAQFTNCKRRVYTNLPLDKNGRSVDVTLGASGLGTHRWVAISFYERDAPCDRRGCFDAVPNRGSMFHDLEPPTATWVTALPADRSSLALSSSTDVPLEFSVHDADTSVTTWAVQVDDAGTWTDVASGAASSSVIGANVQLETGRHYSLRAVAIDKHGNIGFSLPLQLNVPFDDGDPLAGYSSGWTSTGGSGAFQGTYHSTSTNGASVVFSFPTLQPGATGKILGGPGNGTATIYNENDVVITTVTETPDTPPGALLAASVFGLGGSPTMKVVVTSGTFVIDGVLLVP